jgi:CheY-like chemotaxis protein
MSEKNIVVCDDEEYVYLTVQMIMEKMGYTVYAAKDGEAALELAQKHQPMIMFQDIQMPGIDGFEVCRRIRKNTATAHIPLIFVSAMKFSEVLQTMLEVKADYFVAKPFQPNDLATDLYFLAESNFKPDLPSLARLRIAKSLAFERAKLHKSKERPVEAFQTERGPVGEAPPPQSAQPSEPKKQKILPSEALRMRVEALELLLLDKGILTAQELDKLSKM